MTEDELDMLAETLAETLDEAIEQMPLEEAIDVMEYLLGHIEITLGGLYEDRKRTED